MQQDSVPIDFVKCIWGLYSELISHSHPLIWIAPNHMIQLLYSNIIMDDKMCLFVNAELTNIVIEHVQL